MLLACHRRCREQRRSLHLAAVHDAPARLFEITGTQVRVGAPWRDVPERYGCRQTIYGLWSGSRRSAR
ncbi:hypothetical protein HII36_11290 [Nonomuraea sp. NN258]|uniref:hypothetical protein n=1 Tax=Nonomuraea antri TaxID=2730852 RepID=UPI001568C93E|nr:hypothetical protein [Nonomuraea antri]NRQ32419.1 hypothetical protein [Nonomuraea antri]